MRTTLPFLLLAACRGDAAPPADGEDADDTAPSVDTADTADTADPGDTADTDCPEVFDPARTAPSAEVLALAAGQRAFAWELHAVLPEAEGNTFWSPFSVSAALGMLYGGTRGETQAQLAAALHAGPPEEAWHAAWGSLLGDLGALEDPPPTSDCPGRTLAVANRTWFDDEIPIEPAYLALTGDTYGAPAETLDITGDPDAAREAINAWISDRTLGHVTELLQPVHVTEITRFVLVNALYFAGSWSRPFPAESTADLPFTRADGSPVQVPTMRTELELPYAEAEGLQIVELPYTGEDMAMVVLLPADPAGLEALEASITAEAVDAWLAGMSTHLVDLTLPRFEVRWRADLPEALAALGVVDAFDPDRADLTGMSASWGLDIHVTAVVHEAWVKVDENGTEAAAATAVIGGDDAEPLPATFHADRPFLFLVRDRVTGALLFVGTVTDPSIVPG